MKLKEKIKIKALAFWKGSFPRFAIVGFFGAACNLIVFYILSRELSWGINVSAVAAFLIAVAHNYYFNHIWSFKKLSGTKPNLGDCLKYVWVNIAGLGMNLIVLNALLHYIKSIDATIAQAAGIIAGMLLNYAGAYIFVFTKDSKLSRFFKKSLNFPWSRKRIALAAASLLFIFGVVWLGQVISYMSSRKMLAPIAISVVDSKDSALPSARAFVKLARAENIVLTENDKNTPSVWSIERVFANKVYIALGKNDLKAFSKLTVSVGDKKTVFSAKQVYEDWKAADPNDFRFYLSSGAKEDYSVFEAPDSIGLDRSRIPIKKAFFSSLLNWKGDRLIIEETAKDALLSFLLIIAAILAICAVIRRRASALAEEAPDLIAEKKKTIVFLASLGSAAATSAVLGALLFLIYKPDISHIFIDGAKIYLDSTLQSFLPEPTERLGFILGVLSAPFILASYYFLFSRLLKRKAGNIGKLYAIVSYVSIMAIFALLYLGLSMSDFLYIKGTYFYSACGRYLYSLLFFPLAAGLLLKIFGKEYLGLTAKRFLYIAAYSLIFLLIFFMNIFNLNSTFSSFHLNPLIYPLSQVLAGKFLLVDVSSLYGLFPIFLAPIYKIFGFSIIKFALTMSLLLASSYLFLLLFMRRAITNKLILLFGFLAVVYYSYLACPIHPDFYFQYWPIRLLFPCLSLFLTAVYFKNKSKAVYYFSYLSYALALFWNIDSGIIVMFSWFLILMIEEAYQHGIDKIFWKRSFGHLLAGAAAVAVAASLFVAYTYLNAGTMPDLGNILKYQALFASGYFMLPMLPPPHIWNFVVILYLAGLLFSIISFFKKSYDYKSKLIAYLSLLGVGLFAYYEGRSHDLTLFGPSYPALALLAIFADRLFERIKEHGFGLYGELAALLLSLYIIFAAPFNLLYNAREYWRFANLGIASFASDEQSVMRKNIEFIKSLTRPNERILILSLNNEGILYACSRTRSALDIPSSTDWFFKSEIDDVVNFLNGSGGAKIFIGEPLSQYDRFSQDIRKAIEARYKVVVSSGTGLSLYSLK